MGRLGVRECTRSYAEPRGLELHGCYSKPNHMGARVAPQYERSKRSWDGVGSRLNFTALVTYPLLTIWRVCRTTRCAWYRRPLRHT